MTDTLTVNLSNFRKAVDQSWPGFIVLGVHLAGDAVVDTLLEEWAKETNPTPAEKQAMFAEIQAAR